MKSIEEINKLYWIDKKENFFDIDKFAGEGNAEHMFQQVESYKIKRKNNGRENVKRFMF